MSDKKISALTAATTPLAGTEVLPIVQGGVTVKVTNNDLRPKQIQSNATSGVLQVAGPAAAATRVMTTPDANFSVARIDAAQAFTGNQTLTDGNLVIGTSGKGIDFSATPGTGTSELLADYEEGTWTPTITPAVGAITSFTVALATYTKLGRLVVATTRFTITDAGTGVGSLFVSLPFAIGIQNSAGSAIETVLTGDGGRTFAASGDTVMNIARYNNTSFCVTGSTITATISYSV